MDETCSGKCKKDIKEANIVYFSGTGGTGRVAKCFEEKLTAMGIEVVVTTLDTNVKKSVQGQMEGRHADILFILYPVFACDAPQPIYDWINGASSVNGIPAVIISVSGGGEVFPNTACRTGCIKLLENKGYNVSYERMIVMPSNIFIGFNDHLAARLLQVLPIKVESCIKEIFSGIRRRTRPKISSRLMVALFGKYEKKSVKKFGQYIQVAEKCTGCGWCSGSCPMGNIKMVSGRPVFKENCTACLRCYYGCPKNALSMKKFKAFTVKEGYSLDKLEKRMQDVELEPAEKFCKGIAFIGIRKYLFEDK